MSAPLRIWFNRTYSHIRAALDLIRAGDSEGQYTLLCSHPNPHFAGFLAADEAFLEPTSVNASGRTYVDWCLAQCLERRVALFYPGHAHEAIIERRSEFEAAGTRLIAVAPMAALGRLEDKALFYADQSVSDVPGPEFERVTTAAEYHAAYARLRQRHSVVSIKPVVGVYGVGFRVIDEQRSALTHILGGIDYHVAADDLARELDSADTIAPLLVMEYLPGFEYSVDCLAVDGELITAIVRRKEKGTAQGQTIVDHPGITAACRALARTYGLNALFNAQFRENRDGHARVLEINARMSGGTAMACLAGPNLPLLALQAASNHLSRHDIPPLRIGLRVGEVSRATELPCL